MQRSWIKTWINITLCFVRQYLCCKSCLLLAILLVYSIISNLILVCFKRLISLPMTVHHFHTLHCECSIDFLQLYSQFGASIFNRFLSLNSVPHFASSSTCTRRCLSPSLSLISYHSFVSLSWPISFKILVDWWILIFVDAKRYSSYILL